jgi:hypothetical protein
MCKIKDIIKKFFNKKKKNPYKINKNNPVNINFFDIAKTLRKIEKNKE